MNRDREQKIRARLEAAFSPESLTITDESHLHVGHAGAREGKGHYSVRIVSQRFGGHGRLQRHRMVYEALGELMSSDIHALKISALEQE